MQETVTGIIGGGAAGLFAACFLKKNGASFTLLEKGPECGRKLLLTGHGRCNLTNRKPVSELVQGYHEASRFMKPALSSFTPEDVMAFVQGELGVSLKEEENNRIFPVSDKASDIRDALVDYAGAENIRTGFEVTDRISTVISLHSTSIRICVPPLHLSLIPMTVIGASISSFGIERSLNPHPISDVPRTGCPCQLIGPSTMVSSPLLIAYH